MKINSEAVHSLRRSTRKVVLDKQKLADEKTANLKRLGHVELSDAEEAAKQLLKDPNSLISNDNEDEFSDNKAEFGENEAEFGETQNHSNDFVYAGDEISVFDEQKGCFQDGQVVKKKFKDYGSVQKELFMIQFPDNNFV